MYLQLLSKQATKYAGVNWQLS